MEKEIIIICEKDKELARSLSLVLEPYYQTNEVSEFSNAIELVESIGARALVMDFDHHYQESHDFSKFEEFKNDHPDLPIISMYVFRKEFPSEEAKIKSFSRAVLYKPVDISNFLDIIKQLEGKERVTG